MKHSHLFIALLLGNTLWYAFVGGTFDQWYYSTTGQGGALLIHWLLSR